VHIVRIIVNDFRNTWNRPCRLSHPSHSGTENTKKLQIG